MYFCRKMKENFEWIEIIQKNRPAIFRCIKKAAKKSYMSNTSCIVYICKNGNVFFVDNKQPNRNFDNCLEIAYIDIYAQEIVKSTEPVPWIQTEEILLRHGIMRPWDITKFRLWYQSKYQTINFPVWGDLSEYDPDIFEDPYFFNSSSILLRKVLQAFPL